MQKNLNLYSISGIGDVYWNLMRVLPNLNQSRNVDIHVYKRIPFSAIFLKDLKRIDSVQEFPTDYFNNNHDNFLQYCDDRYKRYEEDLDKDKLDNMINIWLHPNKHIENGNRIEDFLPKLQDTQYQLEWNFDQKDYDRAVNVTKNKKTVIIYTSSLNNNTIFGSNILGKWSAHNWTYLIKRLKETYENLNIIWIGASYDHTIKTRFINEQNFDLISNYFIDEPATFILPLLKMSNCFISYQSGLSVLSVYDNVPTCMLYFNYLEKLIGTWEPANSLQDEKLYKPLYFKDISNDDFDVINWVGKNI